MLREIDLMQIGEHEEDDIMILYEDAVYSVEEFRQMIRVLADEAEEEEEAEEEAEDEDDGILILDDEEEEEELPFPVEEPKKSARDSRALITEAVEHGCTTASEIVKYTGLASQTVYNHRDLWKD